MRKRAYNFFNYTFPLVCGFSSVFLGPARNAKWTVRHIKRWAARYGQYTAVATNKRRVFPHLLAPFHSFLLTEASHVNNVRPEKLVGVTPHSASFKQAHMRFQSLK